MRFFRKIAGILGFGKDDGHEVKNEVDGVDPDSQVPKRAHMQEAGPRRGFSVPVQVAVERSQPGPVLVPSSSGDGGVQGLKWYAKHLKMDDDGDLADEFFVEVQQETNVEDQRNKSLPRFQVNCQTRPAKVKKQKIMGEGKVLLGVEHQGRLQWV